MIKSPGELFEKYCFAPVKGTSAVMELSSCEIDKQTEYMSKVREALSVPGLPKLAYIDTYGCQQNESDSEKLRGMLAAMGFGLTGDEFAADIIIINTCAIRENAENRVFGNVGALIHTKKAKPAQIIAICGCMAAIPEVEDKVRQSYKHVDLMFSPNQLWRFPELLHRVLRLDTFSGSGEAGRESAENGGFSTRNTSTRPYGKPAGAVFETAVGDGYIVEGLPLLRDRTVKAWLPIMYGCNNFCSYCIVPYVRGRERSRKPAAILNEAREIIAQGYKDITLLGQNVNSYGAGLEEGINFAEIIRLINELDGEFLIRFMTSHPKDASEQLFRVMAESEKAAKHIHLPFQSGNDRILEQMNRGYSRQEYLDKIRFARELMPDIIITSDVIVGFPGETGSEFEDTLRLVEEAQFDSMFTFIYSKRPGTPAALLPDAATREEKQIRFDRLIELQNSISESKHSQYIGKTVRVLVDEESRDERYPLKARTNGGRLVHLPARAGIVGQFVEIRITHSNSWSLFGDYV